MIEVHENTLEFHLRNQELSYIFRVMEKTNILEHLYFGPAIANYPDFYFLIEREIRPSTNLVEGSHLTSLEHIKQEYPFFGSTDYRYPALDLEYPSGDHISQFVYHSYQISKGKSVLGDLPGTFGEESDVEVLEIHLRDCYSDVELILSYHVYLHHPIITRQVRLINQGEFSINIENIQSLSIDFPKGDYDWIHLNGAWAREANMAREQLHLGVQQISSTRGHSSHMHNPFLALCDHHTTENHGIIYGFSLIYSGNFRIQVERDNYDVLRVQLGINPFQFKWALKAGETFESPEAVMVLSSQGINGMSQAFHRFFHQHLIRSDWKEKTKPILVNNWEATYFNFTEEKLLQIAKEAKDLGMDLFVLDDGWFGKRNSDKGSLGNWIENPQKLPHGLKSLSQKIHNEGLLFGLWFEPEMVSSDTELYKEHPDWIVGHPDKHRSHGRNQFVLDFSNPEVVSYVLEQMSQILEEVQIEYVKLDMNRSITEAYSTALAFHQQGEFFHRYILGVYHLYEELLKRDPHLLIESCAGGGGRFDAGMLYYSPQIWASDDTDAVERLVIQQGLSLLYPLSTIGSHISAVPNHQVARTTSLSMRKDVALFGTFGYELDLTCLSIKEKEMIKDQVQECKHYQHLLQFGDFYRLETQDLNRVAWMVVSQDQNEALVAHYQILAQPNPAYHRLQLFGLAAEKEYDILEGQKKTVRYGKDLETIGLILSENYIGREEEYWSRNITGDFSSRLFYVKSKN